MIRVDHLRCFLYAGLRLGCPAASNAAAMLLIAHHALRQVVLIAAAVHKIRRHTGGTPVDARLFIIEKEAFARLHAQRIRCDAISPYMRVWMRR